MLKTTFMWPEDLAERTKQYAEKNGISQSDVIRLALREKMKEAAPSLTGASREEFIEEAKKRTQGVSV